MAKRPAGIRAILDAFDQGDLDVGALRAFDRPAYFALGGRSNPDYFASMAKRLAAMLPDLTIETFPGRHHFDPPHRVEPENLANSLLTLWQRAGNNGAVGQIEDERRVPVSSRDGKTRRVGPSGAVASLVVAAPRVTPSGDWPPWGDPCSG